MIKAVSLRAPDAAANVEEFPGVAARPEQARRPPSGMPLPRVPPGRFRSFEIGKLPGPVRPFVAPRAAPLPRRPFCFSSCPSILTPGTTHRRVSLGRPSPGDGQRDFKIAFRGDLPQSRNLPSACTHIRSPQPECARKWKGEIDLLFMFEVPSFTHALGTTFPMLGPQAGSQKDGGNKL